MFACAMIGHEVGWWGTDRCRPGSRSHAKRISLDAAEMNASNGFRSWICRLVMITYSRLNVGMRVEAAVSSLLSCSQLQPPRTTHIAKPSTLRNQRCRRRDSYIMGSLSRYPHDLTSFNESSVRPFTPL